MQSSVVESNNSLLAEPRNYVPGIECGDRNNSGSQVSVRSVFTVLIVVHPPALAISVRVKSLLGT